MLKKTITYKDFTGEEATEDFYFNLTESEVIELEVSAEGNSLSDWLQKIVRANNGAELVSTFKKIIVSSYGVKSTDGRRFIKSPAILAEFTSSLAYNKLFMEISQDAELAAKFVNGIMPSGMVANQNATSSLNASEAARKASEDRLQGHQKAQPAQPKASPAEIQPDLPVELETAPPVLAAAVDLNSMSAEQLREFVSQQQSSLK
jgi:hypothetical protein